jgi:RimJ/RimL family protein N-acetyltransferase
MQKYLIKTEHLGLRFIRKKDVGYLKDLDKDPMVKKFFPEGTLSIREINEFIAESISACETNNLPCFVVFTLDPCEFVGEAYFGKLDTGETKIGYLFHQNHWNKGYATEVLKALIDWAKINMDTEHIVAFADKDNTASFHVMENCGMQHYKDENYLNMECKFYRIKIR